VLLAFSAHSSEQQLFTGNSAVLGEVQPHVQGSLHAKCTAWYCCAVFASLFDVPQGLVLWLCFIAIQDLVARRVIFSSSGFFC
jgi:hypothetical protein